MTAHRAAALGADRASLMLRDPGPLMRSAETEYFYDSARATAKASALASLLQGGGRVGLSDFNIPLASNAVSGQVPTNVPQPFLFLVVDWLNDGTDVSYYSEMDLANSRHQMLGRIAKVGGFSRAYGKDRNLQRMTNVSLSLEDIDRSIATRVRAKASDGKTGKYNYSRFYFSVGAPQLTEDYYVPITCPFKVQRAKPTETTVEFDLIDASDDVLFAAIQPPTMNNLLTSNAWPSQGTRVNTLSATGAGVNGIFDWNRIKLSQVAIENSKTFRNLNNEGLQGDITVTMNLTKPNVVPVPFGGWTKAPFAWAHPASNKNYATGDTNGTRENPIGIVTLGASKQNGWMQPHFWGDCQGTAATKVRNEPMVYVRIDKSKPLTPLLNYGGPGFQPNGAAGIGAYIDVHTVQMDSTIRSLASGGETWYVAVLYIYVNASAGYSVTDINYQAETAMKKLAIAAGNGDVYVDWGPGTVSGAAPSSAATKWMGGDKPSAAQVIGYLAQYHSWIVSGSATPQERLSSAIRGENRVIENYDDALTADGLSAESLGGSISKATSGADLVDQICATSMLDQAYNTVGRLALRPPGITARDRGLAIPRGPELTDTNDIIDGTWKEGAPKGDDRWGWGNSFDLVGVQDVAKVQGWDGTMAPVGFTPGTVAGQVVQRSVPIYWKRQDPTSLGGTSVDSGTQIRWVLPYQEERQTAEFDVGFGSASGLDLGQYVYVTHYAGSNADGSKGWNRKLCRIEGLDVRWEEKTVGVTVIQVQSLFDNLLLLDDENRWIRYKPLNLDTFTVVAGNPNVTFNPAAATSDRVTSDWANCIFKVCPAYNPKPYPATDSATYAVSASNSFASRILSVTDQLHFVMANNSPVNGTFYAARVQYSHRNPPPAAAFGGLLATDPTDAAPWTKYLQLADTTTGTFSNGDPAQKFQGP